MFVCACDCACMSPGVLNPSLSSANCPESEGLFFRVLLLRSASTRLRSTLHLERDRSCSPRNIHEACGPWIIRELKTVSVSQRHPHTHTHPHKPTLPSPVSSHKTTSVWLVAQPMCCHCSITLARPAPGKQDESILALHGCIALLLLRARPLPPPLPPPDTF